MDSLLYILIGVAICALLVWLVGRLRKRRTQHASNERSQPDEYGFRVDYKSPEQGDLYAPDYQTAGNHMNMRVGDLIKIGVLFNANVRGVVTYQDGSYTWKEYYMSDTGWLSAEEDPDLLLISWERIIPSDLEPIGKKPIVHNGVEYHFDERGRATYRTTGVTDLQASGTVEYVDYATEDGANFLAFERYDGDKGWEAAIGEPQEPLMVEHYPTDRKTN